MTPDFQNTALIIRRERPDALLYNFQGFRHILLHHTPKQPYWIDTEGGSELLNFINRKFSSPLPDHRYDVRIVVTNSIRELSICYIDLRLTSYDKFCDFFCHTSSPK